MSVTVHNPDQYMSSLRTIIAQGRKKIGFLIGAGAPAGMRKADGSYPLIPAVDGLTQQVLDVLLPKPVSSSNLVSVGYEPETETLEIEFQKSGVYQYYNVPQFMFDQLMRADSVGRFFNLEIKEAYPSAKM